MDFNSLRRNNISHQFLSKDSDFEDQDQNFDDDADLIQEDQDEVIMQDEEQVKSAKSPDIQSDEMEDRPKSNAEKKFNLLHFKQQFSSTNYEYLDKIVLDKMEKYMRELTNLKEALQKFEMDLDSEEGFSFKKEDISKFQGDLLIYYFNFVITNIANESIFYDLKKNFKYISDIASQIIKWNTETFKAGTWSSNIKDTIQLSNLLLNLFLQILKQEKIKEPTKFLFASTNFVNLLLEVNPNSKEFNAEECQCLSIYILNLYFLLAGEKNFEISLSNENYKTIFVIGFRVFVHHELMNSFIQASDLIIKVLEIYVDENFINKMVDFLVDIFENFLGTLKIQKTDFSTLDKDFLKKYLNYFGETYVAEKECGIISIYSLLFIRCFNFLYYKKTKYYKYFTVFLNKIASKENKLMLYSFYCLLNDFLSLKYSVEFSLCISLIGNFYTFIGHYIKQKNGDANSKRLSTSLLNFLLSNLFNDFTAFRNYHFCFTRKGIEAASNEDLQMDIDEENEETKKKKKQKCDCLSCSITNVDISKSKSCKNCGCTMNFDFNFFKGNDSENDDLICGFCKISSFFNSNGIIFDNEKNLIFDDSNEEIVKETRTKNLKIKSEEEMQEQSQKKKKENNILKETEEKKEEEDAEIFELSNKFLGYQDSLIQMNIKIMKIMMMNYISLYKKSPNEINKKGIDYSYYNFIKFNIGINKLNYTVWYNLYKSFENNYEDLKFRYLNIVEDLTMGIEIRRYFLFFQYYVNILISAQWQITANFLSDYSSKVIKDDTIKIIENYINFEKSLTFFPAIQSALLDTITVNDYGPKIKSDALPLITKLYHFNKVPKEFYANILFINLEDHAWVVRKKASSELIKWFEEIKNDEISNKMISLLIKRYCDDSEKTSIKKSIAKFFITNLSLKKKDKVDDINLLIEIFINGLKNSESEGNFENIYYDCLEKLFNKIRKKIKSNNQEVTYICANYLNHIKEEECDDLTKIAALLLVKIYCKANISSLGLFLPDMIQLLKPSYNTIAEARMTEITCKILYDFFSYKTTESEIKVTIRDNILNLIHIILLKIIVNSPIYIMQTALKTYFSFIYSTIFSRGIPISKDNIYGLIQGSFNVLETIYLEQKYDDKNTKDIYSKAISIIGIASSYLQNDDIIFSFRDSQFFRDKENLTKDQIIQHIFNVLSYFAKSKPQQDVLPLNFDAFAALGRFWIKYPSYLKESNQIMDFILPLIRTDAEKLKIVQVFHLFFTDLRTKIEICNQKENSKDDEDMNKEKSDYGKLHLFFQNYIPKFSTYLSEDQHSVVKLETLKLLEVCIDDGHINAHLVLPNLFTGIFDSFSPVRNLSVSILANIFKISKDDFLQFIPKMLENGYKYHKKHFTDPINLNGFVKGEEKENGVFDNTSDYCLDLFLEKIDKSDSLTVSNQIIKTFITEFNKMNSITSDFIGKKPSSESLKCFFQKFEYFEYIGKLIGDFKFLLKNQLIQILNLLHSDVDAVKEAYEQGLKEYKEEKTISKMKMDVYSYFIYLGVRIFLINYLMVKYFNIFSQAEINQLANDGWDKFYSQYINDPHDLSGDIQSQTNQAKISSTGLKKSQKKSTKKNDQESEIEFDDNDSSFSDDDFENEEDDKPKKKKKENKTNAKKKSKFINLAREKMMMTICGISVYFYEFYQIFQLLTVKINRILLKSDKKKFEKEDKDNLIESLNLLYKFMNTPVHELKNTTYSISRMLQNSDRPFSVKFFRVFFDIGIAKGKINLIKEHENKLESMIPSIKKLQTNNKKDSKEDNKPTQKKDKKSQTSIKDKKDSDLDENKENQKEEEEIIIPKKRKGKMNKRVTLDDDGFTNNKSKKVKKVLTEIKDNSNSPVKNKKKRKNKI